MNRFIQYLKNWYHFLHPSFQKVFLEFYELLAVNLILLHRLRRRIDDDDAVRAVHTAFGLDSSEGEAVVYGGSGR